MSFPIVLALGGGSYRTLEVQIWNAFRWTDYGEASSLALIQILITVTLAISYIRLGRVSDSDSGPTSSIRTTSLTKYRTWEKFVIITYLIAILILIGGPIASILRAAFFDPISQNYSLDLKINFKKS